MPRTKIPKLYSDLPNEAQEIVDILTVALNKVSITRDMSDDAIILATAWFAKSQKELYS